jgi:hypothetical protein
MFTPINLHNPTRVQNNTKIVSVKNYLEYVNFILYTSPFFILTLYTQK